ncbi:Ras-related protein Rab-20 [Araneus ventricosus]|uniref:Ras-related protein Rab-20 n=1 Tax=Araneus ventricosus TaxID=182803 RepID=A0A4Y2N058_ARAVE|nr:Ras-related protein Rab-20 [Araneus ventricosus]
MLEESCIFKAGCRGGLVASLRLPDRRAPGSKLDSTEDPSCILARSTSNRTQWVKPPPADVVRKFGEEGTCSGVVLVICVRSKIVREAKVVMVGDASVGKTSLMTRYMEREYIECTSTIGAAFVIKTWGIHDIAIWDTAGEEKYAGMTTFYYRNASAAILTFDMFDRISFYNLSYRYIPILNDVASAQLKVIVANKTDLLGTRHRQVTREEGMELARASNPHLGIDDPNLPYFETSAKTGTNVDEMFEYVFRFFYPNPDEDSAHSSDENLEGSIKLENVPRAQSNFHCCH